MRKHLMYFQTGERLVINGTIAEIISRTPYADQTGRVALSGTFTFRTNDGDFEETVWFGDDMQNWHEVVTA